MKKEDVSASALFLAVIIIGIGITYAGSRHGYSLFGIPLFALSAGAAFLIQWTAFIPAYLIQTEKFFDITGSASYITVTLFALLFSPTPDCRSVLLSILVTAWALRLGVFLLHRVRKSGKDSRFDEIKPSFIRFLNVWTLQGLWVTFTLAPVTAAITSMQSRELGIMCFFGVLVWLAGFSIEVAADMQKTRFNSDPHNKGEFIRTGLWGKSRHPNYFGEIVLWIGIAIICFPVLKGLQLLTLLSPLFVSILLTQISGIPLLEKKADKKWGSRKDYQEYKENTRLLIPRP